MNMKNLIKEWEAYAMDPVMKELESINRLIVMDQDDDIQDFLDKELKFVGMWNKAISRLEDSFIDKKGNEYMDSYNEGRLTLEEYKDNMNTLEMVKQIWLEERNVED
jgi:hypothetical protein